MPQLLRDVAPIWALVDPPAGVDAVRWSVEWLVPRGVAQWAKKDLAVAAAEKELRSEDCHHVAILLAGPPLEAEPVEVLLTGSLLNPPTEGYVKPSRLVEVNDEEADKRLRFFAILQAEILPPPPTHAGLRQRLMEDHDKDPFEVGKPFLARQRLRELDKGRERDSLLALAASDRVDYRRPRSRSRQFTDLKRDDLLRLFEEAKKLVQLFLKLNEPELWPLLPAERDRLQRPPPAHRKPQDYEETLADDPQYIRPHEVLAGDLVLLRLGYDPDDRQARDALRQELHRAKRRSG
jgi:hypothetical protein